MSWATWNEMVCLLTAVGLLATGLLCFLALYQIKLTYSIVHPFSLFGQQPRRTDQIVQNVWLSRALRSSSRKCRNPGNSRTSGGSRLCWIPSGLGFPLIAAGSSCARQLQRDPPPTPALTLSRVGCPMQSGLGHFSASNAEHHSRLKNCK